MERKRELELLIKQLNHDCNFNIQRLMLNNDIPNTKVFVEKLKLTIVEYSGCIKELDELTSTENA